MASKKDDESFEILYQELEKSVNSLEEGGLALNDSIALYERGVKLARRCQEMLQQAELKVTKLQETLSEEAGLLREERAEYPTTTESHIAEDALPLE